MAHQSVCGQYRRRFNAGPGCHPRSLAALAFQPRQLGHEIDEFSTWSLTLPLRKCQMVTSHTAPYNAPTPCVQYIHTYIHIPRRSASLGPHGVLPRPQIHESTSPPHLTPTRPLGQQGLALSRAQRRPIHQFVFGPRWSLVADRQMVHSVPTPWLFEAPLEGSWTRGPSLSICQICVFAVLS